MGAARGAAPGGATPPVASMAEEYTARLRDDVPVASTGLAGLDAALGGGLRRRMILLGGNPGVGKSTLAGQVADSVASQGVGVLYVTLETPAQYLYAASVARASRGSVRRGDMLGDAASADVGPGVEAARDGYLSRCGQSLAFA